MRAARIVIGLLVLVTLAWTPVRADLWIESVQECGGVAPTVTSCTTRFHLRTNFIEHGFRLPAGTSYTGTLESRVESPLGSHTLRCSYIARVRLGDCIEEGRFPLPGSIYRHACSSYALFSTTPGGSGEWRCYTAHSTGLAGADFAGTAR